MTRTLSTLMAVCLGTILLTSTACENKETEAALKTCKTDLGNEQKRAIDQQTIIANLKTQLAATQAKVDEMAKAAQAAKPEEKVQAPEAKKDQPAKAAQGDKAKDKKK